MALSAHGTSTRLRVAGQAYINCPHCNRTVIGWDGDTLCQPCADDQALFQADRQAVDGLREMMCRQCGEWFDNRRFKFCSHECYVTHKADQALSLARAAADQLDLGTATGWLHRLYQYLAHRDGDTCYLCERRVNLALKSGPASGGSRQGPSVDHVVPRSKAGTDDLDNLALTHWICNIRKGNRPIDQFTPVNDDEFDSLS